MIAPTVIPAYRNRNPKSDVSETAGAAAAAKARRLKTIGAANDKKVFERSDKFAQGEPKVGNKEVVKKINVASRPSAGATRAKKEDYRDTTREGHKPKADNDVAAAQETKGAHQAAVLKQAKDTTRKWWSS